MCVFDIKQMKKYCKKKKGNSYYTTLGHRERSGRALSQIDHSWVSDTQTHGPGRVVRVSYFNRLLILRGEPW